MLPQLLSRRALVWSSIAVWAALLVAFGHPESPLNAHHASRTGDRIRVPAGVRTLTGAMASPLAPESVTVVLVTTAECDKARFGIPSLAKLQKALSDNGFAFRVVIRSAVLPARQYGRLLP